MRAPDDEEARRLIGPAITDVAGEPAAETQLQRLVARYHWTASYCNGRAVLEVACGTGQGLGLLREHSASLYACDLSAANLEIARQTYGKTMQLTQADAQNLPFADGSLDVIILLETLYFLPSADAFFREARRILKPGGHCLVSAINKDCPDFNPNHPLYFERYGARELRSSFEQHGFDVQCFGIIPMDRPTLRSRAFQPVKRLAVRFNLIPESMQARALLKRVVFGRLKPMPRDIAGLAPPTEAPVPVDPHRPDTVHQVILCAGRHLAQPA